ncbi:MAG: DUF2971 domain-containing protein [Gemmatimonadaceae bacterium]|nr:DUF2971 domain-containing protein [Gemmatimonadaceae bacterium]
MLQPLEWFSSRRGTVFLVSFSRSANDLSQWRAYGGGSGFALGFSETISLSAERYRDTVDDVRYGRAEQSALVTTALDELLKVSRDDASLEGRVGRTGNLQDAAVNVTRRTLPFLKNPAFGVERERRVAFLPPATEMRSNIAPDGVLVRVRNGRLLRYVEARWDEPPDTVSPLRAIMIGPGQSPSVADDVRDLLRMCQLRDVEILWSEIPLRG